MIVQTQPLDEEVASREFMILMGFILGNNKEFREAIEMTKKHKCQFPGCDRDGDEYYWLGKQYYCSFHAAMNKLCPVCRNYMWTLESNFWLSVPGFGTTHVMCPNCFDKFIKHVRSVLIRENPAEGAKK